MVGLKTQNRNPSRRIDQMEQKLATLQNTPPTSSVLIRANKKEKLKNGASTPPSSCEEIVMLVYYLDGLYLVKSKHIKKIKTVFCKFSAVDRGMMNLVFTTSTEMVFQTDWKSIFLR